jgi:hypothetical protein
MREFLGTLLALLLWLGFYVCVRAFFSSIKRSALRQQPLEEGLALEFFPAGAMQFLVRLTLALLATFATFSAGYSLVRKEGGGLYASLVPMSVFVLILLAKPVAVVIDQEGIRQGRWFRSDKQIAWNDVATVKPGQNTGTTYVQSKNGGPRIRFSSSLVGRARFLHEIRSHARDADIYSEDEA